MHGRYSIYALSTEHTQKVDVNIYNLSKKMLVGRTQRSHGSLCKFFFLKGK
uniref:Uncharacterized protein n=1 Tax=Arundo donax TaxID=35708 RepID=A0A0A9G0D0_ARUDO